MKTLLIAAFLTLPFISANAQKTEVGVHGGYGTTWLINNNVSDQGDNLDYAASFGPVFGIHGGYYFPSRFGVVVEIDYAVVHQKYTGKDALSTFEANEKFNFVEIPILLRKYSKSGFYFEVGPKFSFLGNAIETVESTPKMPLFDHTNRNIETGYKKTIISAAFGIGSQFEIGKNLYADARLRFAYGFTDATKEFSQTELANKAAAKEISVGSYYAHTSQQAGYSYKQTNLATGYVMAGVTYVIPVLKKKAKGSTL